MSCTPDADSEDMDADLRKQLDHAFDAARPGDDERIARVRARVMSAIRPVGRTLHADEGWVDVCPGIERKVLWESGGARSVLMRFAPGTSAPAHFHAMDEECVVLEGTVLMGDDLVLKAGDFHVGCAGTPHPVARTETGAVVYLRGAAEDL